MHPRRISTILTFLTLFLLGAGVCGAADAPGAPRHLSVKSDDGSAERLILIENGQGKSTIVIPAEASEREKFTAADLQRLLRKMSGCKLPIATDDTQSEDNSIQVGKTRFNQSHLDLGDLKPEGFRIKTDGGNLLLAGNDDAGSEFAVYTFLERYCGMGWFWPGESGEVVPRKKSLVIGAIDDLEEPDFYLRDLPCKPFVHTQYGDHHGSFQWQIAQAPLDTRLWRKRNRLGGSVDFVGTHTFGKMAPPAKYGPTHPEYFALNDGKRQWENFNGKHGCQLCTTHPQVVKLATEWARKFLDEHPDVACVTIAPNDGGGFCHCPQCKALDKAAGSPPGVITDRIFTFANQVAEGIAQSHPDRYVLMLAYSCYRQPPRVVKPAANLWVQLCVESNKYWDTSYKEKQYAELDAWAQVAENLSIYDYYRYRGGAELPKGLVPLIEESIKHFYVKGVRSFYSQTSDDFGPNGLHYYVASRLLWNTGLEADIIVDEYCQKCFGRAAGPMRKWYRLLEDRWRYAVEKLGKGYYGGSPAYFLVMFPPEELERARGYIDDAKRLADGETSGRVDFIDKELTYTELTMKALYALQDLQRARVIALDKSYPTRFKGDAKYVEIEILSDNDDKKADDANDAAAGAGTSTAAAATPRELLARAIQAWEARSAYLELIKGRHVIDYWHVKEHADRDYRFDPTGRLKKLPAKIEGEN